LPCQKAFASSATQGEKPSNDRTVFYVIGAAFVAIGGYIFYLAFNESEAESVEKASSATHEIAHPETIINLTHASNSQPIQLAPAHPKFSKMEQYLRRFIAACGRTCSDSAPALSVANRFLEIFSIKGLLVSINTFPSSATILALLPPDLSTSKVGLKVHMRQSKNWLDRLPTNPVLVTDNDLDKEFFAALRSIASADKASSHWPDDLITVHLFLKSMSYDAELSYVPQTDAGRVLHSFLLSEYDFIRSEKWRLLVAELKHID
jgi:hypothetical protein